MTPRKDIVRMLSKNKQKLSQTREARFRTPVVDITDNSNLSHTFKSNFAHNSMFESTKSQK